MHPNSDDHQRSPVSDQLSDYRAGDRCSYVHVCGANSRSAWHLNRLPGVPYEQGVPALDRGRADPNVTPTTMNDDCKSRSGCTSRLDVAHARRLGERLLVKQAHDLTDAMVGQARERFGFDSWGDV